MVKYSIRVGLHTCGVMVILLLTSCASITKPSESWKPVSQIIGEIILEFDASYIELGDAHPFGPGPISSMYEENYKRYVANMPEEERFAYFWVGLWHLGFQEGTMDIYLDVVRSDVASEKFADQLRKFVQRSEDGGRKGWRTTYAEKVLGRLEQLANIDGATP